jgi:hypothetical protein
MSAVKERPILFSGAMVRAILDGKKTQTRRVLKPQAPPIPMKAPFPTIPGAVYTAGWFEVEPAPQYVIDKCPYGKPGDRLWVRETHAFVTCEQDRPGAFYGPDRDIRSDYGDWFYTNFAADPGDITWDPPRFRPSIHMPRWACRIRLEVVSVRVERLNEINEDGAQAEGLNGWIQAEHSLTAKRRFMKLWDGINAKRGHGWESNPWVWVIEFKRVEAGAQ